MKVSNFLPLAAAIAIASAEWFPHGRKFDAERVRRGGKFI